MGKQLKYSKAGLRLPGHIFTPSSKSLVLWSSVAEVLRIDRGPLLPNSWKQNPEDSSNRYRGDTLYPCLDFFLFSCSAVVRYLHNTEQLHYFVTLSNVPSTYLAKAFHNGTSIIPRMPGTQGFLVLVSLPLISRLPGKRMAVSGLPYFLHHKSPSMVATLFPCPAL